MKYKFYPSLLDAFQNYLDCEANYEKFYGFSDEPSMTFEQYEQEKFQSLIDSINRVPFDSEAADRGTVFNEIVDCILLGVKGTRDDVTLRSSASYNVIHQEGATDEVGKPLFYDEWEEKVEQPCVLGTIGDREFYFDIRLCKMAAEHLRDGLPQLYVEATMETEHGDVLLYGYPDYVRTNRVFDLKTTSRYEFGKYRKYWQQHVYPWALIKSGKCSDISAFEFTAFQLKGGTQKTPLITGEMFPEIYVYSHDRSEEMLRGICTQFIEFLENNRALITDKKVFGGEKE